MVSPVRFQGLSPVETEGAGAVFFSEDFLEVEEDFDLIILEYGL